MKRWLAPLLLALGLAGLVACAVSGPRAETEVRWSLAAGLTCSQFNIVNWEVSLAGPERVTVQAPCLSSASYSSGIIRVIEGNYTATVRAISASGTPIGQAKSRDGVIIARPGVVSYIDVGQFTAADLQGTPNTPQIHVFWAINDTEDGTDTAPSWDTCNEVGAAYLRLTVDSTPQDLPCGATKQAMNATVQVTEGTHSLTAVLLNSSKTDITSTTTPTPVTVSASQPGQIMFNFDFDAFKSPIKESTIGAYLFSTKFDGKTCAQVPWIAGELSLIRLNGTAVTPAPQVCSSSGACYSADGNSLGQCSDGTWTMKSSTLKWGAYKLLLQGTLSNKTACYSVEDQSGNKEVDILIGAGSVNPVVLQDLKKLTPLAPGCQ